MPEIGEIKRGKEIGKNPPNSYIWDSCKCGTERWARINKNSHSMYCPKCSPKPRKYPSISVNDYIPKLGDIRRGNEIGKYKNKYFVWSICPICNNGRWVGKSEVPHSLLCKKCFMSHRNKYHTLVDVNYVPKLGDIKRGRELGHNNGGLYIWDTCIKCGKERWVLTKNNGTEIRSKHCRTCGPTIHNKPINTIMNDGTIGIIKRAKDVGKKGSGLYLLSICSSCGKERWIQYKSIKCIPYNKTLLCRKCFTHKLGTIPHVYLSGDKSKSWKGGTTHDKNGYILVYIKPNSPYYSMKRNKHYISEHRLVMAQHLGRCLESWEQVHHCGMHFPIGSIEDKSDNTIENLHLTEPIEHSSTTNLQHVVKQLRKEVSTLSKRITILEAENILLRNDSDIISDSEKI